MPGKISPVSIPHAYELTEITMALQGPHGYRGSIEGNAAEFGISMQPCIGHVDSKKRKGKAACDLRHHRYLRKLHKFVSVES
jgi:hypothetical protein